MRASLTLMGLYIGVAFVLQAIGIAISQVVSLISPTASLFVFLVMYFTMFWIAWPISVRLSYRVVPETDEERAMRPAPQPRSRTPGRLSPARAVS